MEIRCRLGVAILKIGGPFVTGSAPALRAAVSELTPKRRAVLIDMAAVTDMDAHGVGELVCSMLAVERGGGRMALVAPSACVRQLLALTRLDTVLAVYDAEAEALARMGHTDVAAAPSENSLDQHVARQPYA